MEYEHIIHPFEPVYCKTSKILILGSFPSVKSREQKFFYGHPQNRFWKVISSLVGEEIPVTIEDKRNLILNHDLAIWDVIQCCDIQGSSDSSIKNVVPTDIEGVIKNSQITRIYCNGKTAGKLYDKYQKNIIDISATVLPSTSPANAVYSLERLLTQWKQIVEKY